MRSNGWQPRSGRRPWARVRLVTAAVLAVGLAAVLTPRANAAAAPAAPYDVQIVEEGADHVILSFVDGSSNEERFLVERRPWPSGSYVQVGDIRDHRDGQPQRTRLTTQFRAPHDRDALYCYRVKAVNSAGAGSSSPVCTAPTDEKPFSFWIQKPWNLSVDQRYSFLPGNVHSMWVYSTDVSFDQDSDTDPRTEMRWEQEYSSGQHTWDADVYIPYGTDGTSVMQIYRTAHPDDVPATDWMLNVYAENGGTLKSYCCTALKTGIYNKWINVKVSHNADTGRIYVYIDDQLVYAPTDRGRGTHHFKNGVYHHGSGLAQASFRNIRYLVR
jgi:hypothetical protein